MFHTPPVIAAQAAMGGKKESEGPLAAGFDELTTDNRLGQRSWEAAEKQLQLRAARLCLQKAALPAERVDLALAGDLQAQCTASGYALRELGVPFAGLFGACSTMAEALALGAALCSSGAAQNLLAMTSSHFCAAERQFRTPLSYGAVRTPQRSGQLPPPGAACCVRQGRGWALPLPPLGGCRTITSRISTIWAQPWHRQQLPPCCTILPIPMQNCGILTASTPATLGWWAVRCCGSCWQQRVCC